MGLIEIEGMKFYSYHGHFEAEQIVGNEFIVDFTIAEAKALLRNKLDKTGDVILCDNKAKNAGIATAMTRLFNAVSVQKNKPEWLSYFVAMPKVKVSKLNPPMGGEIEKVSVMLWKKGKGKGKGKDGEECLNSGVKTNESYSREGILSVMLFYLYEDF